MATNEGVIRIEIEGSEQLLNVTEQAKENVNEINDVFSDGANVKQTEKAVEDLNKEVTKLKKELTKTFDDGKKSAKNFEKQGKRTASALSRGFSRLGKTIQRAFIFGAILSALRSFVNLFGEVFQQNKQATSSFQKLSNTLSTIGSTLKDVVLGALNFIVPIIQKGIRNFQFFAERISDASKEGSFLGTVFETVGNILSGIINFALDLPIFLSAGIQAAKQFGINVGNTFEILKIKLTKVFLELEKVTPAFLGGRDVKEIEKDIQKYNKQIDSVVESTKGLSEVFKETVKSERAAREEFIKRKDEEDKITADRLKKETDSEVRRKKRIEQEKKDFAEQQKIAKAIFDLKQENDRQDFASKVRTAEEITKFQKKQNEERQKNDIDAQIKALEFEKKGATDLKKQRIAGDIALLKKRKDGLGLIVKEEEKIEKTSYEQRLKDADEASLTQNRNRIRRLNEIQLELLQLNKQIETAISTQDLELFNSLQADKLAKLKEQKDLRTKVEVDILDDKKSEIVKSNDDELDLEVEKNKRKLSIEEDYVKDVKVIGEQALNIQKELDDKSIANKEEQLNKTKELISTVTDVFNQVNGVVNELFNLQQQQLQQSINSIKEQAQVVNQEISDTVSNVNQLESDLNDERGGRRQAILAQIDLERRREAELTKEKVKLEKQAFAEEKKIREQQKAFAISQALINGALAITNVWANNTLPYPAASIYNGIQTGVLAAITATQVAAISNQKYAHGGVLNGPSHAQGGIQTQFGEVEGGEAIINKKNTAMFKPLLSAINSYGGNGVTFANGGTLGEANFENISDSLGMVNKRFERSIEKQNIVVSVVDINNASAKRANVINRTSI